MRQTPRPTTQRGLTWHEKRELEGIQDAILEAEDNLARRHPRAPGENDRQFAQRILQTTLTEILAATPQARILLLPDGPYAVPCPPASAEDIV